MKITWFRILIAILGSHYLLEQLHFHLYGFAARWDYPLLGSICELRKKIHRKFCKKPYDIEKDFKKWTFL